MKYSSAYIRLKEKKKKKRQGGERGGRSHYEFAVEGGHQFPEENIFKWPCDFLIIHFKGQLYFTGLSQPDSQLHITIWSGVAPSH